MTLMPYLVRVAPDSTPQLESTLPFSALEASLSTVRVRVAPGVAASYSVYWAALCESQAFFGRPVPQESELDLALEFLRSGAGDDVAAIEATVMLGVDGTIFVSGRVLDPVQRTGASLVRLEPKEDLLTPRSDWEKQALATNSRAVVDAFDRSLGARGAQDAVVVREDETAFPVLGALVLRIGQRFTGASGTTVVPELLGALLESAALTPRDGIVVPNHLSLEEIDGADNAWWISPGFEIWSVADIAGHTVRQAEDFERFFEFR